MFTSSLIYRFATIAVVGSLLLGAVAPVASVAQGQAPGSSLFIPLITAGEQPSSPPVVPGPERPADPVLQATGDPNLPPTNHYGPKRKVPGEGPERTRAYEPFGLDKPQDPTCPPHGCDAIAGEVAVKFTPAYMAALGEVGVASVNATFASLGITGLEPLFPDAPVVMAGEMIETLDGDRIRKPDLRAWYRAGLVDTEKSVVETAAALRELPEVAWAEPVYVRRPTGMPSAGLAVEGIAAPAQQGAFTDPLYAQQWHLAAANVPAAWNHLAGQGLPPGGNRDIVVAVIDTGIDLTHPDLVANLWVDPQQPTIHGRNFTDPAKVNDPSDDHGHGTHVAGIIAAQAGNGIGGVGVAYNVQLMALKAAQYSGVLASTHIAQAIYYAVENGADVINMSFGGYARSQVEEDALAVAFGSAVLVAAAGNDGYPNEGPCIPPRPMYPAAHNWVLGVMASAPGGGRASFSNYDCTPHTSREYELMAPGVDVWSTLPREHYAAWAGTSMATPIVAGIAALARTQWSDKDVYSSRFIMGQIAANAGPVANAHASLTIPPKPELRFLEYWLFDTSTQAATNDDDGIVDAGETVDLAIVIRNHWGKADNVQVTLEAWAEGAVQADPYVTMITDTVDYGAVGSFNADDNGLIYDQDGVITGVRHPFRFHVGPETPNDHVIPFLVTMTASNGYDSSAPPETFTGRFSLIVQRGRELPRIISEDMTLTADYYWLIPDQTLIEAGVTMTVTEGTQVQFWSADPDDPYSQVASVQLQVEGNLIVSGTYELPVEFFSGANYGGWSVTINRVGSGVVDLRYIRMANPRLLASSGAINTSSINYGYFWQVLFDCIYHRAPGGIARCDYFPLFENSSVSNSIFHKLGGKQHFYASSTSARTSLFDSNNVVLGGQGEGNVYLKNYKLNATQQGSRTYYIGSAGTSPLYVPTTLRTAFPVDYGDRSYARLQIPYRLPKSDVQLDLAEAFAVRLGGHIASISDASEQSLLQTYFQTYYSSSTLFQQRYPTMNCAPEPCWNLFSATASLIGLIDRSGSGDYSWLSGDPVNYTNWGTGHPILGNTYVWINHNNGGWYTIATVPQLSVILELPAGTSDSDLEAVRQQMLTEGDASFFNADYQFRNNAILNVWRDPDIGHWLRFHTSYGRDYRHYINHNYWGTNSTVLIDAAIQDYNDDFNRAQYVYQPILTEPSAEMYPFVVDVILSTAASPDTNVVGAEPVEFTVIFNRDMDPSVQPQVSFGPDVPFTDYSVHSVQGGWHNARTWVGTFNITPITGDGYQLMRVAGAVAADDPWLVTGDDSERFAFEIITSGAESMNLQASGGEGYVDLMWTQTDFDLLAGFNLYRATSANGTYTRINDGLIPSHIREYRDTNVTPGVPYYYKFTVVQTSMAESDFSNTATATPVDTIPPVISHSPVTSAPPGLNLALHADVTDNVAVQAVTLYYRAVGGSTYSSLAMVKTTGNRYNATIPGSALASPGIQYYIAASDGVSTVTHGRPENPHTVAVSDRPVVSTVSPLKGPSAGGTNLTVSGSNFKVGATVTLGGAACDNVTVASNSQITCVTPPRFPGTVDVVVTNPDAQSGTKLNAFTFESDSASLSLPAVTAGRQTVARVPVNIANLQGLVAADLRVAFDPAILTFLGASTGTLTPGWTVLANVAPAGQVNVALISPGGGVSGGGVLLYLDFDVVGAPEAVSALTPSNVLLNDGSIPVESAAGSVTVEQVYRIGGAIQYWNGGTVPAATLNASGDRAYSAESDAEGIYALAEMARGNYTVTPAKANHVDAVSAYDASLVLQHSVGMMTLSGHAATAADVNKSGAINSMDAYYILQAAVELLTPPFPGAGKVWEFAPSSRSYSDLSADQHNQHFTAILLGEVSGNWNSALGVAAGNAPSVALGDISLTVGRAEDGRVVLPIRVDPQGDSLFSLELSLSYAGATAVLEPLAAMSTDDWMIVDNRSQVGKLRVAMAGTAPITTADQVLQLVFVTDPQQALIVRLEEAAADEQPLVITEREFVLLPEIPVTGTNLYLPSIAR